MRFSVVLLKKKIDCGCCLGPPRRGGINEYLQSVFFNQNKKNNVYSCEPHFPLYEIAFIQNGVFQGVYYTDMLLATLYSAEFDSP